MDKDPVIPTNGWNSLAYSARLPGSAVLGFNLEEPANIQEQMVHVRGTTWQKLTGDGFIGI